MGGHAVIGRGRTHQARRRVERLLGVGAAALVLALTAVPASAGGTVGDPQPELAPFHVGSGGSGTGAVLADGTLVLAAPNASGTQIDVCMLHPGERACAATSKLDAFSGDSFYGTVQVLATGGTDIAVVSVDCCNIGDNGAVVFDSTNDGRTFGPELQGGDISGIGTSTYADGQIVVATEETGSVSIQAFSANPSSAQTNLATPLSSVTDEVTSVATYDGGVLVAIDDGTNTHVLYARADSNFNSTSSYASVGTFANQTVFGVSGNALVTDPGGSITGGGDLRFFNGTSFGPAIKVPDSAQGDDGYYSMQQVGNETHVFFLSRRTGYDAFMATTTTGAHWSLAQYASAIDSDLLSPVLGPTQAGLLFENDGSPFAAQPILNPQAVHVALAATRVRAGHATTLRGTAAPRLPGQLVTLEELVHGAWYPVKTTHESASGAFSFSIPGRTDTYRAVVADKPGYDEYGYSNAATLTATT